MPHPVLALTDLTVAFDNGRDGRVEAVRGISLDIARGECLGVVGESGSGKTLTFMTVMGLPPAHAQVGGSARLHGVELIGADERRRNAPSLPRMCSFTSRVAQPVSVSKLIFLEPY